MSLLDVCLMKEPCCDKRFNPGEYNTMGTWCTSKHFSQIWEIYLEKTIAQLWGPGSDSPGN